MPLVNKCHHKSELVSYRMGDIFFWEYISLIFNFIVFSDDLYLREIISLARSQNAGEIPIARCENSGY